MRLVILMSVICAASAASAAPCGHLAGDARLVTAVAQLLEHREVVCDAVAATLHYDGQTIVITSDDAIPLERRVSDIATAATVVESWSASIAEPLLASRPVPVAVAEAPAETAPQRVVIVERQAPPIVMSRGWQLFAAGETSFANDRTSWVGAQVGGCVEIGPLCASARVRFANVVAVPSTWDQGLERRETEILIGADIPLQFGKRLLLVGFGGGTGQMHTRVGEHMGSETGGLRADVHTSYTIPLGHELSVDLSLSIDVTQATRTESSTDMPLPPEPLFLGRFGIGLRYGRL
jgi:hypothetical protein